MASSTIDHLVVTAPTLASGIQYVEQTLDCKMQPGGQHPRLGTHKALLKIGEHSYLEVISIDPDTEPPRRKRWFELDGPTCLVICAVSSIRWCHLGLQSCHAETACKTC